MQKRAKNRPDDGPGYQELPSSLTRRFIAAQRLISTEQGQSARLTLFRIPLRFPPPSYGGTTEGIMLDEERSYKIIGDCCEPPPSHTLSTFNSQLSFASSRADDLNYYAELLRCVLSFFG